MHSTSKNPMRFLAQRRFERTSHNTSDGPNRIHNRKSHTCAFLRCCRDANNIMLLLLAVTLTMCHATDNDSFDDYKNKSFDEISARILNYNEERWVMKPASHYVTIIKGLSGTGPKSRAIQFADCLEEDFQEKFNELIDEMLFKERLSEYLFEDPKFEVSRNNLNHAQKCALLRYNGRAAYLKDTKSYKLANIQWVRDEANKSKCNKSDPDVIKQGHMNVLAIGLSNETSGFAEAYNIEEGFDFYDSIIEVMKDDLPDGVKIPSFLTKTKDGDNKAIYDCIGDLIDANNKPVVKKFIKALKPTVNADEKTKQDEIIKLINYTVCPTCEEKKPEKGCTCSTCEGVGMVPKEECPAETTPLTMKHCQKLSKLYFKWTCEHKVPMEEMFVLHSNSDPEGKSMDDGEPVLENRPFWKYGLLDHQYRVTYRMGRVLTMLLRAELDLMTVVELDCYEFFLTILKEFGYDGCFQAKLGQYKNFLKVKTNSELADAKHTPGKKFWHRADGAAIFWLINKLDVDMQGKNIETKCNCLVKKITKANDQRFFKKNSGVNRRHHNIFIGSDQGKQVAMDMVFKIKRTNKRFGIITGHLKSGTLVKDWNKKKRIVEAVAERAKYLRHKYLRNRQLMPVIISGDINTPENTCTYRHLFDVLHNTLPNDERKMVNYEASYPAIGKILACYMKSSYSIFMWTKRAWRKAGNQCNKLKDVKETEDYQFYTLDIECKERLYLQCTQADHGFDTKIGSFLETLSEDYNGGCPNGVVPSDHIMIATAFKIGNSKLSEFEQRKRVVALKVELRNKWKLERGLRIANEKAYKDEPAKMPHTVLELDAKEDELSSDAEDTAGAEDTVGPLISFGDKRSRSRRKHYSNGAIRNSIGGSHNVAVHNGWKRNDSIDLNNKLREKYQCTWSSRRRPQGPPASGGTASGNQI